MKLLLATRSAHKVKEVRRILRDWPSISILDLEEAGLPHQPEEEELEPFDTFEENALSKARYFHRRSGLPTVADDSGLCVDALGGRPGVRSKRFAPDEGLSGQERDTANNRFLLRSLDDRLLGERTARYVCVAALVGEDGEWGFRGEAEGLILGGGQGWGGFGYDPLFYDRTLGKTFAQLTDDEKNARSHRGAAFRAMARHLAGTSGPAAASRQEEG